MELNDYEMDCVENYYGKPFDEITQDEIDAYFVMAEEQLELREENYQLEHCLNGGIE